MSFWSYMFSWWHGGVWSNIVASLIWALPTWGFLFYRQSRHNKRVRHSLASLHAKHDKLHDKVEALNKGKRRVI